MTKIIGALALALLAPVFAAPNSAVGNLEDRAANCANVQNVINYLKLPLIKSLATSYCSSLIQTTTTTTITSTVTATTTDILTFTTPTTTIVETSVITQTSDLTITEQLPDVVVSTTTLVTVTTVSRNFRREAATQTLARRGPFPFLNAQLSKACSCIITSIPTKVITKSTSVPTTVPTTVSTTVGDGASFTTQTTTTDITETTTLTVGPTTTIISVVSTATTVVNAPPICGVRNTVISGGQNGQYAALFSVTRAACQASCDADTRCRCIIYAATSMICSLHTPYCSNILPATGSGSLLYYEKFCPV